MIPKGSPGKRGDGESSVLATLSVRNDQAKPIEVGLAGVWQKCPRTLAMVTLFVDSLASLYLSLLAHVKNDGDNMRNGIGGVRLIFIFRGNAFNGNLILMPLLK